MAAVTIYRVPAPAGPADPAVRVRGWVKTRFVDPIATLDAETPVAALEEWAARCGFADFSVDEDGLAFWLCPSNAQFFYYAYREIAAPESSGHGPEYFNAHNGDHSPPPGVEEPEPDVQYEPPDVMTRAEYIATSYADPTAHQRYYGQFASPRVIGHVVAMIGGDRIAASTDPHFNDIPLRHWDSLSPPADWDLLERATGSKSHSLSDEVCISKAAARAWLEARA